MIMARPAVGRANGTANGTANGAWRPTWALPLMAPPQGGGYYEEGAAYGPPPDDFDEMAGLQVDRGGWSGGVGGDPAGGGGGFGQLHFGQSGNQENGPTYNKYNQSFQYNPSEAAPFRPRLVGGFAPPAK